MTAEETLVIILGVALAVFLVLAIALTIMLIIIAKKINRAADMAEQTAEHVERFVANVQSALAPAALGSFLMDLVGRAAGHRKKGKEDD